MSQAEQVKLPYYPKQIVIWNVSPFGVPELNCHKIYDSPLDNKAILRVDAMACLGDILGAPCLYYRDTVYDIVAGNTPDYRKSIHNLYSKFPKFREYANEEYYYGDTSKPLSDRILEHMQESIAEFVRNTRLNCDMTGGKYLTYTHHYLYYAYATRECVPSIMGGTTIC